MESDARKKLWRFTKIKSKTKTIIKTKNNEI
jgi:hypothetical protein